MRPILVATLADIVGFILAVPFCLFVAWLLFFRPSKRDQ